MRTADEILNKMLLYAPLSYKEGWDNVGLLGGSADTKVNRILLCLDITSQTVQEAVENSAELLISHHPILFETNCVTEEQTPALYHLLRSGKTGICLHTNLDAAPGGVNDSLAEAIELEETDAVDHDESQRPCGLIRFGIWTGSPKIEDFARHVGEKLNAVQTRYISSGKPVHKVGLCSGSGMSVMKLAKELGCDTFVTGECKHSACLEAKEAGMNIVAAGHYSTEAVVLPKIKNYLEKCFPDLNIEISKNETAPFEVVK